jgi:E3 ubiquitin-protein ligase UBR4
VSTAIEQNRTPCKCLVPVTDEDTVRDIYQSEESIKQDSIKHVHEDSDAFTKLMVKHFSSECRESLKHMVTEALQSDWRDAILLIFNQHYQAKSSSSSNFTDISDILSGTSATQPITGPNLRPRSGQPLTLTRPRGTCPIIPIRAAKASTLQSRMISSSSSSMRKARNDSHVQIIAADNRGRLFVAESSSVLFCCSIPSVNVRYVDNSPASHLSRSQLNILGTDSVKFSITGMVINSVNNRHLLLWGVSKACVAIVSKNFESFERIIDLKLNLEPSEECEHIVKCDWMPQSELQVVAVCGAVVHVFDLKRAEKSTCNATTHYALAYEDVLIRSATLVGSLMVDDGSVIDTKLALLLDTGRLYFISLTIDEEGNLEDHGESYIEIGAGLSFPSAGIRRYSGGEPGVKGATATTFGEGVYLAYLRQSNLLLYQCVSSCCIAMLLDEDGAICGSFELLPNMIAADELGGHYGVLGPYTHFQELGIVTRDKDLFYRVACVGRSTRSNQPMALILEFNANQVYVRELSWPSSCNAGLGFVSGYNFVGSCTFSCPYLVSDDASGASKEGRVHERAFLTLLSSSGSLLWFGEDCQHLQGASTDRTRQALQHQIPKIGYFEQLINASELEALTLGGDFVGKDPQTIKRKLSLNNTDYVISPSCVGCTLTASLQDRSLAIVAVRILVGSMPDMIPKEIIVMGSGRSMKLKLSMKRWYDYILTEEEILLAVRNGFVTIWISSCHVDSSSAPIIDSVEVYARARSELAHLSPVSDGNSKEESLLNSMKRYFQEQNSNLVTYIQTLTCLTQITGRTNTSPLSSESKETISNIIQQTALESAEEGSLRHQTIEFLSEAEGDIEKRTYLIDEATLSGIMSLLQNLTKYLQTEYEDADIISSKEEVTINRAIEMLIIILSSTITIARVRGSNYMDIISSLIEKKSWLASLALEGKRILDLLQYFKAMLGANLNLFQPAQLVSELMLLELACSTAAHVTAPLNCIAQFDTLSEYLVVDSFEIIKACCAAISTAIGSADTKRSSSLSIPSSERELSGEGGGIITYQCDSCLVFPITSQRFTLGGEADIDLCKSCYDSGMEYSKSHGQTDPIIINGRTLGIGNEDMKCGTIWRMVSKPIAESSALSAENAKKAGLALKTMGSSDNKRGDDINMAKTEGFKSHLFTKLLGLMTKSFDASNTTEESSSPSVYVLQLILDVVLGSCTEELKAARGKEMALAFTQNLASLVKLCQTSDSKFSQHCSKLVVSLRTLAGLVRQNREIIHVPTLVATADDEKDGVGMFNPNHKSKTDPRFVCEHEMPAVRRRCSHGVHKDRRFYVCGLDRSKRCNYFKWSDDTSPVSPSQNVNQLVSHNEQIFVPVQMELQRIFSSTSLQEQFASLVSSQFETKQGAVSTAQINEGASNLPFTSIVTDVERAQDKEDGVFLALEKFGILNPIPSHSNSGDLSSVDDGTKDSFLSSSLNLFSLIAPTTGSSKWCNVWFSVLCEIISRSNASSMETSTTVVRLARSMLQRLCGDRIEVYHRVRDHYVFGIQFRKLFQRAQDILDSALIVREQARQCGSSWREEEVMFDSLPASGLLGVEDLISEDEYTTSTEADIGTVLDELLSAAIRVSSWRKFCGLPGFNVAKSTAAQNFEGGLHNMLDQIYHRPPIVSLMWLSSSLRGSNQVKALSLLELALGDETSPASVVNLPPDDIDGLLIGDHQTLDTCPSCPELCLHKCFTENDLIAFVKQFVLNGRSKQLRAVAAKVTRKLANQLSVSDKQHLVTCLINGPFQQVGAYGIASKNFIELLIMIVGSFGSNLDLSSLSLCIAESFISQMTVLNERFSSKSDNEMDVIICNLSNCVHCQRQMPKKTTKFNMKKPDSSGKVTTPDVGQGMILPDQVRPYQRGRLESSVNASVSSEFSSHNQLKFRIALSQIHVTVTDPRGRLVKSIGVYYTPRQVSDVNVLKSDKYSNIWQRCGTLTLARGATEATCKLTTPVIAANLKFIYEDFFEKASNKRASDGSFILYCPRCTRQVNNAHGVCGNCGEVAFQCRKCRHINYDSLDAFLCVECGYCTAGSFTYELTAGIAINATAILDEDGFQRSMAMLRVANKRQSDLRTSLKRRATVGKNRDYMENLDEMVLYGPHLKRALLGYMPKSEGADDEDESNRKSGSKVTKGSSAERASSSSSRARSLLSLARSLRAEGSDGFSSRGDLLRQALLNAGSGPGGLDSADAADLLNALSANINARTRDESGTGGTTGGSGDGGKNDNKAKLTPAEERNRLYSQMREAERECYELNRRIDAWNRLNNDCLTGSNSFSTVQFMPSTCFTCSSALAYQILLLLCSVYATGNAQFECTITSHLIKTLMKESVGANSKMKDLNNLKRQVIVTLACTTELGSKIILSELKLRLNAVQDVTSAEILGTLIQLDFPSRDKFVELADTVLGKIN